ncbi:MAG: aconitate hydratase AcnA [Phycisphaeraceae bacterium]|nr:aconitate hydratase AcnA [Phycisphaeraceae bacterium]
MTDYRTRTRQILDTPLGRRTVYALGRLGGNLNQLPYCIKVLLEACLRHCDGYIVTPASVDALMRYNARQVGETEIPFMPGRVVLQDFTGVPAVVDLAAMRAAMKRMGGDPRKVNPLVPCDLVIDHSVQVDAFGSAAALTINSQKEFERNTERYEFLKWGQQAFDNFRVVPPATGIVHQVNLEYLAKVVWSSAVSGAAEGPPSLYPDSLVGTDSHTTMINGLGVVGWGVGGIEAEAVMLGQPIYMLIPEVVGFKLVGKLPEHANATDLVLTVTQMLRKHGVVNKFVEFFGPGMTNMPLANRATLANMAPEYGATIGFFPVDEQTLKYLRLSGRDEKLIQTVEQYARLQGLWRDDSYPIVYSSQLELDLSTVEPCLAGPKRPQDRIALSAMKSTWQKDLTTTFARAGAPAANGDLADGHVVIAAITSCTNTSNPEVMLAAGLLARKARQRGLSTKPWVKTSLAPGSKVVTDYYEASGLNEDLDALGFQTVGYGCTTCIGNSGPLPEAISKTINERNLVCCSVLSGNRNFEGRVNPDVKANYLASPPLVVAYALAGTVNLDLATEPLGNDPQGKPVYLRDIWPTPKEVQDVIATSVTREQFQSRYADVFAGSDEWKAVKTSAGALFQWDDKSTYVQEPPFFVDMPEKPGKIQPIRGARCLAKLADSVTTDHISPAGSIKKDSPAGKFLTAHGVPVSLFNSYGARRGNDRVMVRGTFANTRIKNQLAPGTEGGVTKIMGTDQIVPIFDAAVAYGAALTSDPDIQREPDAKPLVVLAGKDYGMGSSRDWAAKGTFLLGVRAVIAESYERIHRSNLVGMGVLPLCYQPGQTAASLGLDGTETFDIDVDDSVQPRQQLTVRATKADGKVVTFQTLCRIDTPVEVDYYRHGGILHCVLRKMAQG